MIHLRLITLADAPAIMEFERAGQDWFTQFVPPRPDAYWQLETLRPVLRGLLDTMAKGQGWYYLILDQDAQILGRINLTLAKGIEACALVGYRVAADRVGRGIATGALGQLCKIAPALGLRELRAEVDLTNIASVKVLQKTGFAPCDLPARVVPFKDSTLALCQFQRAL